MNACRRDGDDLVLSLHVQPGARDSAFAGSHGEALKLRIAAPAVDGRANRALVEFLAEQFAVPRRQVRVEHGAGSRAKRVRVVAPRRIPGEISPH